MVIFAGRFFGCFFDKYKKLVFFLGAFFCWCFYFFLGCFFGVFFWVFFWVFFSKNNKNTFLTTIGSAVDTTLKNAVDYGSLSHGLGVSGRDHVKKSSSESSPLGTLLVKGEIKTRLAPLHLEKKTVYFIILVQE